MRSSRVAALLSAGLLGLFGASCAARSTAVAPAARDVAGPAQALDHDLAAIFAASPGVLWGVRVESLDHPGEPLFMLNADRLFVPASNMKLLTVAAAASRLGWDHTFTTTVRATTALAADGTIRGDLVVRGDGDPTIGDRATSVGSMTALADALWARGVRRIEGRVIGDDRAFAREPLGEGWAWDDLTFGYSAPVGALIYNDDTAQITVTPAAAPGAAAAVALVDVDSGLTVSAHVTTGPAGSDVDVETTRELGSTAVRVTGSIPLDHGPLARHVAVASPTRYFTAALRRALTARGIFVRRGAAAIDDNPPGPLPPGAPVLATLVSPTLDIIATRLLKVSQNLYAEALLRDLDVTEAQPGSAEAGLKAVRATLEGWGVAHSAFAQSDGSGLSRYNLVTPSAFVQVLTRMHRDPALASHWIPALPVGGVDGTLTHRFKGTAAEGRVHAKTGTLSSVATLSGYVQTTSGEWLVVSILANNFADPMTSDLVENTIDAAVVRLATFAR